MSVRSYCGSVTDRDAYFPTVVCSPVVWGLVVIHFVDT